MAPPRRATVLLSAVLALLLAASVPPADPAEDLDRGSTGLGLALRRVGTSGRVLCVTAHPDDEPNATLIRLSRGLGVRTALFTLTRGEGGQNAIGPELFDALGVLRTSELMAMHQHDGVEQLFGQAYEFGYSFSVDETLQRWGHEETLGDVVRAVRRFRPDVILTLPTQGEGGGQHHQATGRLALEAFRASADPQRFPEHASEGLRPWQARTIYAGGVGGGTSHLAPGTSVRVPVGIYDPLLGLTWHQAGSRARALHRCQMMPQLIADPGPAEEVFTLLDAAPSIGEPADLLDGVDTRLDDLARLTPALAPALAETQRLAQAAKDGFDARDPEASVPRLSALLSAIDTLLRDLPARTEDGSARDELAQRLGEERGDVVEALWRAQGLQMEARAADGLVVPGQEFLLSVHVWNNGRAPVTLERVEPIAGSGWTISRREGDPGEVPGGGSRRLVFAVKVAEAARTSQPHWRRLVDRDRNASRVDADPLRPFDPPELLVRATVSLASHSFDRELPAIWRHEGASAGGEKRHPVQVVPRLAVRLAPDTAALPVVGPRRPVGLRAFVRNHAPGAAEAEVRLETPAGWTVRPASTRLAFGYEGEERAVRFELRPPARLARGAVIVQAVATSEGREYREGVQAIEYDHVERQQLVRPARTRLVPIEARLAAGISVGYVMGPGDTVAEAIDQLGAPLALLGSDELAFADLSRFTTIVTGIRAYETRPDLRSAHGRLMRWVEQGGHLVIQYNRASFNRVDPASRESSAASPFAPFPARVGSGRISDETAAVTALVPRHPLLTSPNRIGAADWEGWVQERGIQLLEAGDSRYQPLLAATDPFPYNPGEKRGLLVEARVGRGTWTYVGLALFRQVAAGVPGAYRLLANLVSRPRPQPPAASR